MEEELKLEILPKVDTKEIETALETNQKVDEKVVEKSLNYDLLTEEEKSAIDAFLEKIDVKNTTQILQFGSSAQNNISKFFSYIVSKIAISFIILNFCSSSCFSIFSMLFSTLSYLAINFSTCFRRCKNKRSWKGWRFTWRFSS